MLNRKVLKMQDSLYVAIPKQLCSLIGIKKGDTLCIEYANEKIIIAPVSPLRPSGAGKSTIISQYSDIPGMKIKDGHVTKYEYLKQTKDFKAKGICTLIHEDISKIHPERELLNVIPYWHMVTDNHVLNEAFKPHVDEFVCIGLLLTCPNGFLDGRVYETMTNSGVMNRMLKIIFDSSPQVRHLLTQANRHNNVNKTTIPELPEAQLRTQEEVEDLYGKEVYDLSLSGQQQSQILNLIEHGCSLETIKMFLKGNLVFK